MFVKTVRPFFVAIIAILIACTSAKNADTDPGWRKLGEKKVNYGLDKDVVNVSIRDGRFKKLRFVVTNGSLNMHKCIVHFENGGTQEIELRHSFRKETDSRVVDLKGNERFIEKIVFWYDTKTSSNGKAELSVFGK